MELTERLYYFHQVNGLRPYILSAFREKGIEACEMCGAEKGLEIDHRRYGDKITLDDLRLLCSACHKLVTLEANDLRLGGGYCPYCQRSY